VLADTFQLSRTLTERYIQRALKGDIQEQVSVGNITLKCSQWIIAHLAWSQHALLLQALGSPIPLPDELIFFKIGSTAAPQPEWPSIDKILNEMKNIHEASMQYVRSLNDDELMTPNIIGLKFGEDNSKRIIIQHAIRHESMHCGHLSWICKIQGLK
jgi:hypothetical protein